MLERRTIQFRSGHDPAPLHENIGHTDIEEVELRRGNRLALACLTEGRELISDQRILQHLVVLTYRPGRNAGIVGYRSVVQKVRVGQSGHLEKSREALDGAHQALSPYFFLQIPAYIGLQIFRRISRIKHSRQAAGVQPPVQKLAADLPGDQRVQAAKPSPACKQVCPSPAQFSGAASGKNEADRLIAVDECLRFIQHCRQFLDLIDDDQLFGGFEGLPERLRVGAQLAKSVGFQQIDIPRIRKGVSQKSALSGLARSQQEQRSMLHELGQVQYSRIHANFRNIIAIFRKIMQLYCGILFPNLPLPKEVVESRLNHYRLKPVGSDGD